MTETSDNSPDLACTSPFAMALFRTVAALIMAAGGKHMPEIPFEMHINRPFCFLIQDEDTHLILFAGVVADPR